MSLHKARSCLLVSTLLLSTMSQPVQAITCPEYARRSVAQQEKNVLNLCGFRGSQWSSNYNRWLNECLSMSTKDRQHRLSMREKFLSNCPVLNYSGLGRNRQSKLQLALLRATEKQDIRLVETLIREGVNLSIQPKWLMSSPLFITTLKNNYSLAKVLIQKGAKPYLLADGEENLLNIQLNRDSPNYPFMEYLLQNKASPNRLGKGLKSEYPLVIAAAKGDFRSVVLLLKYNADPNLFIERPALQLAVEQDHYPITRALIQKGANPNLGVSGKSCVGKMALDIAFRKAKDRIIDLLLDNRALSERECNRVHRR